MRSCVADGQTDGAGYIGPAEGYDGSKKPMTFRCFSNSSPLQFKTSELGKTFPLVLINYLTRDQEFPRNVFTKLSNRSLKSQNLGQILFQKNRVSSTH